MSRWDVTLLCTGDLHLGRHPTRIPPERDGAGFSPKTVWHETVEKAVEADVDAVVITGDVVDLENRYFEAYGAFEAGARALAQAGIPAFVVGGNHDAETLPRMVDDIGSDTLHLLGRSGNWERHVFELDGKPALALVGWSFPMEHVRSSPLRNYALDPYPGCPTVGVLHGDLGVAESDYAPVSESELSNAQVDAWLLGHIHKPGIRREDSPLILYPGSPQPLDPGEVGAHGPWFVRVDRNGQIETEHCPMATVRYETFNVDVSDLTDAKELPGEVSESLSAHIRQELDSARLALILARVVLTGRSDAHADLAREREVITDQLGLQLNGIPVVVESLVLESRPAVDLEELSQGDSPVAWLAKLLQNLENGRAGNISEDLVEDSLEALRDARWANAYNPLGGRRSTEAPGPAEAYRRLTKQARLLLDVLLEQKEQS